MAPREPALTLGIEEEYLLVDLDTRELVTRQDPGFMRACQAELGEQVTHELLQSQVEVGTVVCRTIADARRDLARLRATVSRVAQRFGMGLIAASTHPSAAWQEQRNVDLDRYRNLTEDYQAIARRLVICGMHVHAGIEDDELRIDLMNQLSYFLPHLLALSTSSPFWQGQDTGLKSFRLTLMGNLPRTGIPELFESYGEWQRLLAEMDETGVCDDATKIWWDARPSAKHPTLEMRICDVCTSIEDTLTIAALYQALLGALWRLRARNQTWRLYRPILIGENKWRAQRFGTEGRLADYGRRSLVPFPDLLDELIALVADEAERLGCRAEVERARGIVTRGTSADRQLWLYKAALTAGANEGEARRQVVDWLLQETVAGLAA
jgi:glutamate---cysteine ligase / carboxylate-amine ligase